MLLHLRWTNCRIITGSWPKVFIVMSINLCPWNQNDFDGFRTGWVLGCPWYWYPYKHETKAEAASHSLAPYSWKYFFQHYVILKNNLCRYVYGYSNFLRWFPSSACNPRFFWRRNAVIGHSLQGVCPIEIDFRVSWCQNWMTMATWTTN